MSINISVTNHKGGVGKTTVTVNLAASLARLGFSVTVVDVDPQANSSRTLGPIAPEVANPSLYDLITNPEVTTQQAITTSKIDNVWLIYANLKLMVVDNTIRLGNFPKPWEILRSKFKAHTPPGDIVLFDCPPSLSLLTTNALMASDYVLIPVESGGQYSMDGLDDLMGQISGVRTNKKPDDLKVLGFLLSKHTEGHSICRAMRLGLQSKFGNAVLETTIRQATAVRQAETLRTSIVSLDRRTSAAQDFEQLTQEILTRLNLTPPSADKKKAKARPLRPDQPAAMEMAGTAPTETFGTEEETPSGESFQTA